MKLTLHDKAKLASQIVAQCACARNYEDKEIRVIIELNKYNISTKRDRKNETNQK